MIKVYKVEDALAELRAARLGDFLTIDSSKPGKGDKGSEFHKVRFNIGGQRNVQGWFSFTDVPIRAVLAPGEKLKYDSKATEYESTRLTFRMMVSESGALGEFMQLLNTHWLHAIEEQIALKKIIKGNRTIHDLIQTKVHNEKSDKYGHDVPDPIIRFKIDFRCYAPNHPLAILRGQPKTTVFDYTEPYTDERGRTKFKVAVVKNNDGTEEPLTDQNIHKFLTGGSIIRRGRFSIDSLCVCASWISIALVMHEAIVEPCIALEFEEDDKWDQHSRPPVPMNKSAGESTEPPGSDSTGASVGASVGENDSSTAQPDTTIVEQPPPPVDAANNDMLTGLLDSI